MVGLTLAIAVGLSLLVLCLSPVFALVVYVASILLYPDYLVVQIGTVDLWLCRIVGTVLLCRCLASSHIKRDFRWNKIDTWVTVFIGFLFIVRLVTVRTPFLQTFERLSGLVIIDLLFSYLVFRFCIRDKEGLTTFVKWIAITVLIPLTLLGFIEACSGWAPFIALKKYTPWYNPGELRMPGRFGLERAVGPFGHPIMFGTGLAMFLPLVYALRHDRRWRSWALFLSGLAIAGALISLSSGPFVTVTIMIGCLALETRKHWIKPAIVVFVVGCMMVHVISTRPFYHVLLARMNPLGGTSWHRAKLIDLAIRDFGKWWLVGYRDRDPGWGPELGGDYTDITNHYIVVGVQAGLLAVILFWAVFAVALRELQRVLRVSMDREIKAWAWAVGTIIVALMVSFFGCTLFDQTKSFFFGILGLAGSLSNIASRRSLRDDKNLVLVEPAKAVYGEYYG